MTYIDPTFRRAVTDECRRLRIPETQIESFAIEAAKAGFKAKHGSVVPGEGLTWTGFCGVRSPVSIKRRKKLPRLAEGRGSK